MFNGIQVCFLFFFKVYSKALFKSTDILTRIMQVPIKTLKQFRALIAGRGENPSWLLRQINTVSRPAPARHTLSLTHAAASQAKSTRTSNRSQGYPNESHVAT